VRRIAVGDFKIRIGLLSLGTDNMLLCLNPLDFVDG
jgi:hypothetical protein